MTVRLGNYIIAFVISSVLFVIFKILGLKLAETIFVGSFIMTSLMLVFTKEELATEHLEVPEVHYYQSSRTGLYGYIMAGGLAISCFFFYLFAMVLDISFVVVSFVLWLLMILIGLIAIKLSDKYELQEIITDYLSNNLHDKTIHKSQLRKLVSIMITSKAEEPNELLKDSKKALGSNEIPEITLQKIVTLYIKYVSSIDNELTSDEIKETQSN